MNDRWVPANQFPPGRNEPCFCGSGQRFKRCCGSNAANRPIPHGLHIDPTFLSARECEELVSIANGLEGERLQVVDIERSSEKEIVRKFDDRRVTELVAMGDAQQRLDEVIGRAFREKIIPSTGHDIDWYEQPQLLRYHPGGFYEAHADADNYHPERDAWRRELDRDTSVLLYLNDDFEGGCLRFTEFDYRLRPSAGMLVWFPSDHRYMHHAEPVTAGRRYAIVSWASHAGVEKVMEQPPAKIILGTDL